MAQKLILLGLLWLALASIRRPHRASRASTLAHQRQRFEVGPTDWSGWMAQLRRFHETAPAASPQVNEVTFYAARRSSL